MRCLMCERIYSEEHGNSAEGFCSESCKRVYEHLYGTGEIMSSGAVRSDA